MPDRHQVVFNASLSTGKAIEIAKTIYAVKVVTYEVISQSILLDDMQRYLANKFDL